MHSQQLSTQHELAQIITQSFKDKKKDALKYVSCRNMFNTLHTVFYAWVIHSYEIKIICHRAHFFIISYGRF